MKLPSLIRSNPRAARDKARSELQAVRARLVELADERKVALVDADSIGKVAAIDTQLAAHAVTVRALQDRIRALAGECRRVELERLERERQAAIADVIEPQMAKIAVLVADLESHIAGMGAAYAALEAARRELFARWPQNCSRPKYYPEFTFRDAGTRITLALKYAAESGNIERLAEWTSHDGRGVTLGESVKDLMASYLGMLRSVPIELPPDDDDAGDDVGITDPTPEPPRGLAALATS
jgi:hypothetical protein